MRYVDLCRPWATVLAAMAAALLLCAAAFTTEREAQLLSNGTRQLQIAEAPKADIERYLATH
jgi:hypothetical protein